MRSQNPSDYVADTIGTVLIAASVTLLLLYPDLPGLAVSSVTFALTGLMLLSGGNMRDRRVLEWERVGLAAWLALSPWVVGIPATNGVTWTSIVCATIVFVPAALQVSQPPALCRVSLPRPNRDVRSSEKRKI